jgi:hypothetical protein
MKCLLLTTIFSITVIFCYAQATFEGKIYEALIVETEVDGMRETLKKDGTCEVEGIGGRTSTYCVLTFEQDSVSVSYRHEKWGTIFEDDEKEIFEELGQFFYKVMNQTIRIKNFQAYDFMPKQMLTLIIKNEGEMLIVKERKNPFLLMSNREVAFHFKGLVQETEAEN